WAAANSLSALDECIRETIEWARERRMFGATLLDQQWVQFKLVELQTELESLRALTWAAGERYVAGDDVLQWASMAKLKAGRLMRQVTDTCLQFWGGMGYTLENRVSRMYRDGRLASIGGGADEVMMGIIAKTMGMAKRGVA
ncbi:MAG: acyl-CoA dehydrogenase family protein, partial [Proteobacteria bacterium]|nr:acyl-CoA dehydrogenase family protein [Pseudomonadota bacterium]